MDDRTFGSLPYTPGGRLKIPEPLSHFLPPVPDGVISSWLKNNIPAGSWILDPFGASPRLAVEAARAGYRLLVTANNPIARFLIEMSANPPEIKDLKSALAELAASYKGDERVEPHIQSLYITHCLRCGQNVSVESFYWDHESQLPYMRVYTCPICGDTGEYPCTPFDVEHANQFSASGLHKARALERIVTSNDPDRMHVEQALSVYLPRTLYALITIINKLEGLNLATTDLKRLYALLLYAFDQANAMWRVPGTRERRRHLTVPKHFREINVWMALEQGIEFWGKMNDPQSQSPVPVTIWPNGPPSTGGICIYEGRLISIVDALPTLGIKAVCAAIPRPNQAFWTLSALWAGWLWGRDAVSTFKSVLHRQRYDWGWHTNALYSIFKQLMNVLGPPTQILGLLGEAEPGYVASALVAAGIAGCSLQSIALRTEEGQAQICWTCQKITETIREISHNEAAVSSARRFLESRGEPASYFDTFTSALEGISRIIADTADQTKILSKGENVPIKTDETVAQAEPTPSLIYSNVYSSIREALTYREGFLRYNLQALSELESENRIQNIQSTLFSAELGKIDMDESGEAVLEIPTEEVELSIEKERSTRSSDISESDVFWLRNEENINHDPLTDRYEMALLDYLTDHPRCSFEEIEVALCHSFPGLYTPDKDFLNLLFESYVEPEPDDPTLLHIRHEDELPRRRDDLVDMDHYLHQIGDRLGISCTNRELGDNLQMITWVDDQHELDYQFYPRMTAAIGRLVLFGDQPPEKAFIVLPASRANLIVYKLRHDPRLNKAFSLNQGNWRFIKFRHLRSLAETPLLSRANLNQLLGMDPLTYSIPQLRLI